MATIDHLFVKVGAWRHCSRYRKICAADNYRWWLANACKNASSLAGAAADKEKAASGKCVAEPLLQMRRDWQQTTDATAETVAEAASPAGQEARPAPADEEAFFQEEPSDEEQPMSDQEPPPEPHQPKRGATKEARSGGESRAQKRIAAEGVRNGQNVSRTRQ